MKKHQTPTNFVVTDKNISFFNNGLHYTLNRSFADTVMVDVLGLEVSADAISLFVADYNLEKPAPLCDVMRDGQMIYHKPLSIPAPPSPIITSLMDGALTVERLQSQGENLWYDLSSFQLTFRGHPIIFRNFKGKVLTFYFDNNRIRVRCNAPQLQILTLNNFPEVLELGKDSPQGTTLSYTSNRLWEVDWPGIGGLTVYDLQKE